MNELKKSSGFGRWKLIALLVLIAFVAWNAMMFLFGMAGTPLNAFGPLGILVVVGIGFWAFTALWRQMRSGSPA